MTLALTLAFVSGFIALSYEILWYRAVSLGMSGRAHAFGFLLAGYLLGIAAGAWLSRTVCASAAPTKRTILTLSVSVLSANVLGFLFVPALAQLMTTARPWMTVIALLVITVAGLGSTFPLIAQIAIPKNAAVGRQFSFVYAANILGSTLGSALTGLVLLDQMSMATLTVSLAILGVLAAFGVFLTARPSPRAVAAAAVACCLLSAGIVAVGGPLFSGIYEKLILKQAYRADTRFAHVVETRAGVVAVDKNGTVFGNGLWDGAVNLDLRRDDLNGVRRAYMIGALHAAPKLVLEIGLGAGAWTTVLAENPLVERITTVEVDSGHVKMLGFYPEVAGLTSNPKVSLEIDDIRRWLLRHPNEKFDLIIANPTFDWRANATSLLSVEYLELIRQHLNPGGVYFYNTTGIDRVTRTGTLVFPYAWRLGVMLAVSDSPFAPDLGRLRQQLADYRIGGKPALRLEVPADAAVFESVMQAIARDIESRDSMVARVAHQMPITDDNMGTEWPLANALRFWRY